MDGTEGRDQQTPQGLRPWMWQVLLTGSIVALVASTAVSGSVATALAAVTLLVYADPTGSRASKAGIVGAVVAWIRSGHPPQAPPT